VIEASPALILHYGLHCSTKTIFEGLKLACEQGKLPGIDTPISPLHRPRDTSFQRNIRACGCGGKRVRITCRAMTSAPRASACRHGRSSSSAREIEIELKLA